MDDIDLKDLIYEHALLNAAKHKGQAKTGAVIGSIMASHPNLRSRAQEIIELAEGIVDEINSFSITEQKDKIIELGISKKKKPSETKQQGLSPLPNVEGGVVLRFAPNPSGPLHIGHARAAILNQEYVNMYGGRLILRIEDTDPRRVDPEAYNMIPDDLNWLGLEWQELVLQSDRLPVYYEYAEKLLNKGAAYTCTCSGEEFRKLKNSQKPCSCRDLSPEENLERYRKMFHMEEGSAVVRIKTDLEHKNPAIRDWVALRIVDAVHPRTGEDFRVYPLMNFSVAIDDHLLGITHVLRGKDHLANTEKQKYLYDHFNWKMPYFIHYGRMKMEDIALSTTRAREGIEDGKYQGWDDPRLGTLRALRRRGIRKEALYKLMIEIGTKIADTTLSWKKLYGLNRALLEKKANRYFFTPNPERIKIENLPQNKKGIIKRPLHPDFLERGYRDLNLQDEVYLAKQDIPEGNGKLVRLMDAVNIVFQDDKAFYDNSTFKDAQKQGAPFVQWIPVEDILEGEVVMPDASVVKGFIEPAAQDLKVDDVVQLERFGFVRVDKLGKGKIGFYYAHK